MNKGQHNTFKKLSPDFFSIEFFNFFLYFRMLIVYNIQAHGFYVFYIHMAVVVKWLTQRIVAPSCARSNRVSRPIRKYKP